MKNILIDINIYSYAFKGDAEIVSVLQKSPKIAICSISIGEFLSGFKKGRKEQQNREQLKNFLSLPRVEICRIDEGTADFYSDILNTLKQQGRPIPTNDIWIAASAIQHGLRLFSKDHHFRNISGLTLIL
jgi:tRNA(fMet)-specific endonuclease VapC